MNYRDRHASAFRRTFKLELKDFWSNLLGFDILAFESALNLESATLSLREVVVGRFGIAAAQLVDELLAIR